MRHIEDSLAIAVAQLLTLILRPGVVFSHIPNGGKRNKREAGRLKAMGVRPGFADIILLAESRAYFIELKAPISGRQSEAQRGFQLAVQAESFPYAIARDIDAVHEQCKAWGLTR